MSRTDRQLDPGPLSDDRSALGSAVRRAPRSWKLIRPVRPWTASADRRMTQAERFLADREWCCAFSALARAAGVPHLDEVFITAMAVIRRSGEVKRRAAGACYPAVAAAIGGLVDAGVIAEPEAVRRLVLLAPAIDDHGGLVVIVNAVEKENP